MTYKQIIAQINTYQVVDQGWMTDCLNLARMDGTQFASMSEFFDWACPYNDEPNEYESAYMELIGY